MSLLSKSDAIWAADQFIEYYSKFNRIDDYMRFVKQSRIQNSSGKLFGPEDEIFSDFSIQPNDMSFTIHEVDTSSKPKTKYNQELYSEILKKISDYIEIIRNIIKIKNTKKIKNIFSYNIN